MLGNLNIKVPGDSSTTIALLRILTNQVNPLFSLPFLFLFIVLAWYWLPIAVALLPLTFPFYYIPKAIYARTVQGEVHAINFSLVEITLWLCVLIAGLQWILLRRRWPLHTHWKDLRNRLGPLLWPCLLFFVAALIACFLAFQRQNALRAFREEILGPLLYVGLVLLCLRTRTDIIRLAVALFSVGVLIACIGVIQFQLFHYTLKADYDGLIRITTVYGSANNIGLLLDYALPIGLALVMSRIAWPYRLIAGLFCLPAFYALYLSDSRGSFLLALPAALIFVIAFALRNRRVLVAGTIIFLLAVIIVGALYSNRIVSYVLGGHTDANKTSSISKRPYLWMTAANMIHDYPWFGVGMDNWLCHYSNSWDNKCLYPDGRPAHVTSAEPPHPQLHAYLIGYDPKTLRPTGLLEEPGLSHPHNIFLHVWISIGVFGLIAFVTLLIIFWWLFVAILLFLHRQKPAGFEHLRWIVVGVGAAMLAALLQGQGDSSFLEQDLAFCLWTLVALLLLVRSISGMSWRALLPSFLSHQSIN